MSSGGEQVPTDGPNAEPAQEPPAGPPSPGPPTAGPPTAGPPNPGPPDEPEQPTETKKKRRWPGGLELFVAIMLGLAAIASAYAAWRNEKRNHDATAHFSEGIRDYDDGGQFYAEGQSVMSRDQALFFEYAKAKELGQNKLANYIFLNLMSPTLQAGVRWWQGPNQSTSHPARNPFTPLDPDYSIQQLSDANKSYDSSKKNFEDARAEQQKADRYTLIEVILATALFLYGVAGVTRNPRSKVMTVVMGTVIFLIALILLIIG
jgi:hypothetical protein